MQLFIWIELLYKLYRQHIVVVLILIGVLLLLSFLGVLKEGPKNNKNH